MLTYVCNQLLPLKASITSLGESQSLVRSARLFVASQQAADHCPGQQVETFRTTKMSSGCRWWLKILSCSCWLAHWVIWFTNLVVYGFCVASVVDCWINYVFWPTVVEDGTWLFKVEGVETLWYCTGEPHVPV